MMGSKREVAWNLFIEARKEILEFQRIRTQIIGFKITFVSAGIGLIAANADKLSIKLLAIPAFAAIFFDLLATSYGFAIKRTGHYCLKHVEPLVRKLNGWPDEHLLWEEFIRSLQAKQALGQIGNIGITLLAVAPAIYALLIPFPPLSLMSWLIALLLLSFLFYDISVYHLPQRAFPTKKEDVAAEIQKLPEKHLEEPYGIVKGPEGKSEKENRSDQSVMARLRQIKISAAPDFSIKAKLYDIEEKNAG